MFLIWPALSYGKRLALALALVLAGFAVQVVTRASLSGALAFLSGAIPILAGNLLLLVKIRITLKGQHRDFPGLCAQVVVNEVNGTSCPYLHVVLIARKGYHTDRQMARGIFLKGLSLAREVGTGGPEAITAR